MEAATAWFGEKSHVPLASITQDLSLTGEMLKEGKVCFPDEELANLCQLPFQAVEALHIYRDQCPSEKKLGNKALEYIGACLPSLRLLDMDFNNLSSLEALKRFPTGLEVLKLIGNPGLAEADFTPIEGMPQLRSLYIQNYGIRSENFQKLRSSSLQTLDVAFQKSEDFREMNARFPNLRVLVMRKMEIDRKLLAEIFQQPALLEIGLTEQAGVTLREEDRKWAIHEAPGFIISDIFSESEVINALEKNPSLKKVYVKRGLTADETKAVFNRPLDQLIFNSGELYVDFIFESAQEQGIQIRAKHLIVNAGAYFSLDSSSLRERLPAGVKLTEYEQIFAINDWAIREINFRDFP